MGMKLFNVPSRMTRNEMTANLDRKKNSYKASRKVRMVLGIPEDTACKLAIGEDNGDLWIKAVGENEPHNAHITKLNMISNTGMVIQLDSLGNHFEITDEKNEEGYCRMVASTIEDTATTEDVDATTEDTEEDTDTENSYSISEEETTTSGNF
jgi:hypothetical protein